MLGKLLSGTFWLALRTPLSALSAFWSVPLMLGAFGEGLSGAYRFAWGFGFFQFLLEFGMSSALQREVSERWTKGDRAGVDRAISCGTLFYAIIAVVQAAVLMTIAYGAMSHSGFVGREYRLIIQLLWLQALTAPCYGISVVVSSILQAARQYEVMPRFELLIVALRFAVLLVGVAIGAGLMMVASDRAEVLIRSDDAGVLGAFSRTAIGAGIRYVAVGPALLTVVIAQTIVSVGLSLGPALWVIARKLDYRPRFARVRLGDFRNLAQFSFYMFLVQLSVVLADKIDTTVLGFALPKAKAAEAVTAYWAVSSPFLQLRQLGWTLAYFVMPAVASLAAVGDHKGLDRVTYDGARLHTAAVLPVGLLAFLYAGPFLELWVGAQFAGNKAYTIAELTWLMRLFMVAALPLLVAVHVQVATGMGRIAVVAVAAMAGAVVNLPLSLVLTYRLGVSGVIWGTVLTTLFSNLIAPAVYTFRVLEVRPAAYLRRTLLAPLAGALAMLCVSWIMNEAGYTAEPRGTGPLSRMLPFAVHLAVGGLAFVAGYATVPAGRSDLGRLLGRLLGRDAG